jgi:prepilin-type N-terminal cleavage/methylation domain-containing protein
MTVPGVLRMTAVPRRAAAQRAYTIIELLVVVVLLSLAASIVTSPPTIVNSRKLDLTASEIANAIRFARSEAMRTGNARGFHQQKGVKRIRVFSIDNDSLPATVAYDVYHPLDKKLYVKDFNQQPFAFDGDIRNRIIYRGNCNAATEVYFDAGGIPWCSDPDDILLEEFEITLNLGSDSRVVTLDGITGRVTVQ